MHHADELGAADAEAQKSFDELEFCGRTDPSNPDHKMYWNFRNAFDSKLTIAELLAIHDDPRNHPLRRTAALDEAEARHTALEAEARRVAAIEADHR